LCNATLLSTKVALKQYQSEPAPVERVIWQFRIEDEPYFDKFVWGSTGTKVSNHPNCKIYAWSEALYGMNLPPGYRIHLPDLWRRPCRVLIGARPGTNKKNEEQIYNFVEEVLPPGPVTDNGTRETVDSAADEPF
jgi:hypothetical protein